MDRAVQTKSVLIQSLCVPCFNHCRYCLLSWDHAVTGAGWERSVQTAERFLRELKDQRPEINSSFSFGYSMDHPNLREALRTLRRLGSPTASFLQCDGMRMRDGAACRGLMEMLRAEGVLLLNFTVYGLPAYHDLFAGRKGDFDLIGRMMHAAKEAGIPFTTRIPLTAENAAQADKLIDRMRKAGSEQIMLFVPNEEGRGKLLRGVRLRREDLKKLAPESRSLLNQSIYRTEAEWLETPDPVQEKHRHILISLRPDNMEVYEQRSALSVVREIEEMDERYYAAFPDFGELATSYGNPEGDSLYHIRDLYYHYRTLYAEDHGLHIRDIMDETQSGSRRF